MAQGKIPRPFKVKKISIVTDGVNKKDTVTLRKTVKANDMTEEVSNLIDALSVGEKITV